LELIDDLQEPFHRPRHRRMLARIVSDELGPIGGRADEPGHDRFDPLRAREIVPDDRLVSDSRRGERDCYDDAGPVLAGGAVHEHRAVGARDRANRADNRVRTTAKVAHVRPDDRLLLLHPLVVRPTPRLDRVDLEVGVAA